MSILLDLQCADDLNQNDLSSIPDVSIMNEWLLAANKALIDHNITSRDTIEISIRVVSENESQFLNKTYRNKDKSSNVLSFTNDIPDYIQCDHIGDLVICAKVVADEALEQKKSISHHWAHMIIHGLLHLLGFDHIEQEEAQRMENLEVVILNHLGIDDPYTTV